MKRSLAYTLVLLLTCITLVAGCKSKPPKTEPEQPVETAKVEPPPPPPPPTRTEVRDQDITPPKEFEPQKLSVNELTGQLETIYFEFDQYELTEDARRLLQRNADVAKQHGIYNLVVEGHCDERGTIEYNLALGERRAKVVRDYLLSLGIGTDRVRIVSYGEERPNDPRHGESAWSQNRRAEFKFEQ